MRGAFTSLFTEPVVLERVTSTQDVVKNAQFPHFKPLVAAFQTAGRGRRGNKWFSPPKAGLYLSFKLPRDYFGQNDEFSCISLVCGLAVSETVDSYTLSRIKWPNDVYIGGKKVSGILVEATPSDIVVGIGVNLNTVSFPAELQKMATSIYLETQNKVDFNEFLHLLLENLSVDLLLFRSEGFTPFVEKINRKLLWKGKRVVVDQRECGKLLGVNRKGFAVIRTCYGELKEFPYGDISIRRS